jgi:hypothetical protein
MLDTSYHRADSATQRLSKLERKEVESAHRLQAEAPLLQLQRADAHSRLIRFGRCCRA